MKTFSHFICFLSAVLIFTALQSCKKISPNINENPTNSEYYVKFKLDGVQKNYYICAANAYDTLVFGAAFGIGITAVSINGEEAIDIGLYDNRHTFSSGNTFTAQYTGYYPQATISFVNSTTSNSYSAGILDLNSLARSQVTVLERTTTYIKGNFSADLLNDDYAYIKYHITEGEFYVKVK